MKEVYYNQPYQLVRYESRSVKPVPESFFSIDPLVSIHDFNIGVSFSINKNLRNCSFSALSTNSLDVDKNFTMVNSVGGAYIVRLKSPESFLLLDSDYSYTGKHLVNNVQSNVYMSKRKFNKTDEAITEFSFSSVFFQDL